MKKIIKICKRNYTVTIGLDYVVNIIIIIAMQSSFSLGGGGYVVSCVGIWVNSNLVMAISK
jgi:hypothetical protein